MTIVENLKKNIRAVDLALAAGRKRQSPRTGFVHHFLGEETASDTIPIFENFCFAFALFRQKTAESVLEGKELIDRLLAFQTSDGNFPIYIHDYPRCWDFQLASKIAPILIQLLRHFGPVLDSEFKQKVEKALLLMASCKKKNISSKPETAQEWFDWIVEAQLTESQGIYPIPYNDVFQAFLGEKMPQEKGEPQPTAIEYILAESSGMNERLLRDHMNQLYASILFPFTSSASQSALYTWSFSQDGSCLLWKGKTLHSLLFSKGKMEGDKIVFEIDSEIEMGKGDLFEALVFMDVSSETSLFIEEKKGIVFRFGEWISIKTPQLVVDLKFDLIEGEGVFCGNISRGNRPSQIACRGPNLYEAYDWQIGIRTLRRSGPCKIAVESRITNFA